MPSSQSDWLKILNPVVLNNLGHVRHALFDFDGTLSVLRQGWEPIMESVMLDAICPGKTPPPSLVSVVRDYIDASTGQLTILQMQWLSETVRSYGAESQPLSAGAYKKKYLQGLMVSVSKRLEALESGAASPDDFLIDGSFKFIRALAEKGIVLYVASGSDHLDVVREANALGIAGFFKGGIYGALEGELNGKERVIQRILDDHHLMGHELLVVGDGPVEIIEGRQRNALTLGVASDEVVHRGWNEHKVERLTRAGADLLVADFSHSSDLTNLLVV